MTAAPHHDPARTGPGGAVDAAKASVERTKAQIDAEVARAKTTVEEVRHELSQATDDRRGGPATSIEDAEAKATALRQGILRDVAALRARVPETSETLDAFKRLGLLAGGAIVTVSALTALLTSRLSARGERKAARRQAVAIAEELRRLDLGDLREALATVEPPDPDEGGSWGRRLIVLAALGGAGAVAVRRANASAPTDPFGPA